MKSKIVVMIIFVSVFVLASSYHVTFASDSKLVGVKPGDWAEYKIIRGGHGNTAWAGDFEFADSKRIEFVSVSASVVEILETTHYTDGKDVNSTSTYDVLQTFHQFKYIAPANLTVGYSLPDTFGLSASRAQISKIALGNYAGEDRMACIAESTYSEPYAQYVLDIREEYCWDTDTGLLLTSTFETTCQGYGNASLSYASLLLEQTNLWGKQAPPLSVPWLQIGVILGSAMIGTGVILASENHDLRKMLRK
jgi:hypothetical protein